MSFTQFIMTYGCLIFFIIALIGIIVCLVLCSISNDSNDLKLELKDFKKIIQESLENINNYNKIKGKEKNNINNSIIKSLHKNEKIINKKE